MARKKHFKVRKDEVHVTSTVKIYMYVCMYTSYKFMINMIDIERERESVFRIGLLV